ncbi:Vgb family protein [Ovoidimarina sediminis]|uniref:Vgb family protein n=1 Tax=Ovoidimarina sediminis TaxID=3079856 RepID=UPI002913C9B1|nr:NHL repeat-containing protein [Rhodophyticola sp. MJ-SS7]MDU8945158.1 NHL repeat-containing protein [Rhodophyticola sp. MJ-SS7]
MRPILALLLLAAAMPAAAQNGPPPFASFAGASAPVLGDPHDLTFGPDGNLYIADKLNDRVVLMDPETLEIIGSIGDGALSQARDVSFGPDGRLYVAATGLSGVVVYDMTENRPVSEGMLGPFPNTEGALAHSNGRLYVMASGTGQLFAVEGDSVVATADGFFGAHDVEEAPDGSIWVADNRARRLVRLDQDLNELQVLAALEYRFQGPRYMTIDPDGLLIVADQEAHRVLKIDPFSGALLGAIGSGTPGEGPNLLDDPEGVTMRGNAFYISDSDNNRIVKYIVVTN